MIRLEVSRAMVDVFDFRLHQEDIKLQPAIEAGTLSELQKEYLFNKYCKDSDGFYVNLSDSYEDDVKIEVSDDY